MLNVSPNVIESFALIFGPCSSAHTAYSITVASFVELKPCTGASSSYSFVPFFVFDHPLNTYPSLMNVFFVNFLLSENFTLAILGIVPVPPLLSNAIVYVFSFHSAYKVVSPVNVPVLLLSTCVPVPSSFVFHPLNVYPSFVGVTFDVCISAPFTFVKSLLLTSAFPFCAVGVSTPVPPLRLYVTVTSL